MSVVNGYGYLIDSGYVRRVNLATGAASFVSGNGVTGCLDNATPSSAKVGAPANGSMANDGTYLYWADLACTSSTTLGSLRRLTLATGAVQTIPGAVTATELTVGGGGSLFIGRNNQVLAVDTATGSTTLLATLPNQTVSGSSVSQTITGFTADATSLWVTASASSSGVVSSISSGGTVTTVLLQSPSDPPVSAPVVSAGSYLYVAEPTRVVRVTKSNGAVLDVSGASTGYLDAIGAQGWYGGLSGIDTDGVTLWITDKGARRIRALDAAAALTASQPHSWTAPITMSTGEVTTAAGNGVNAYLDGTGAAAEFSYPTGLSIYNGYAYIVDGPRIRKMSLASRSVSVVAGGAASGSGVHCVDAVTPASASVADATQGAAVNDGTFLYWLDGGCGLGSGRGILRRMSFATGAVSTIRNIVYGRALTIGPAGELLLGSGDKIWSVDKASGALTLIATTTGGDIWGLAADATRIYAVTRTSSNTWATLNMTNLATGGTSVLASADNFAGTMVSAGNELYTVASTRLFRISKASGTVSLVAGPHSGYADGVGGNAGFNASVPSVGGVDTDGSNLWFTDLIDYRIRKVTAAPPSRSLVSELGTTYPTSGVVIDEQPGESNPSEVCGCSEGQATGHPVNTAWGTFWHTFTDLQTAGRGPGLSVIRTYNSHLASQNGIFGYGWSTTYGVNLTRDATTGNITVRQEDGSTIGFAPSGGSYAPLQPRMLATLAVNSDGTYTFKRRAQTTLTFNVAGRLTTITDLNGFSTTLSYDSTGQLFAITDTAGRSYTVSMSSGRVVKITDFAGHAYDYAYSAAGDLTSVTDPTGSIWSFGYDTSHRLLTMLDPRQHGASSPSPLTNTYDSLGRVTSQADFVGRTTAFDYTSISGATKVTDPAGHIRVDYYTNGQRTKTTTAYGTALAADTTYTYDSTTGAVASATDPLNHTTSYTYDAAGHLLSRTDPMSRTSTATYDSLGDVLTSTDGTGVTTTNTYDAAGNLLTSSTPLLSGSGSVLATRTATYTYADAGHPGDVTAITDPNGNTVRLTYDNYGDRTSVTAAPTPENSRGNITRETYDTATGWLTSTVAPKGNTVGGNPLAYTTTYSYDANGRLTQTKDPLWSSSAPTLHQATLSYDLDGNVASATDGNGRITSYSYDAAGQLVLTTRPDSTTISQTWALDSRLHTRTDAAGHTTTNTFDAQGNLASTEDPLGQVITYSHDLAGRLTLTRMPGAICTGTPTAGCTSLSYDADNEVTARTYLDGATPNVISVSYDSDGRRTGQTDGAGTSAWSYDSLGRLTSSMDGNGVTTSYGYDLTGNQTSVSYPGTSHRVSRTFDSANRLRTVSDWLSNTSLFDYDPNGNLTATTLPAGTAETDTKAYDANDQITQITATENVGGSPTTLASFSYTRGGRSQLTSETTSGITAPAQSYGYNDLSQLTASGSSGSPTTYAYSAADTVTNRGTTSGGTSSTITHNADDQLCWSAAAVVTTPTCSAPPAGATTYTFDANGNRTSAVHAGAATDTFTYDEENELTAATTAGGSEAYTYDGDRLRQSRTAGGTTRHFTWDQSSGLPLLLSDDTTFYVYGPGDQPLEQLDVSTGAVTWLHQDQLGSIRLLTDNSGATTATATYDPYGVLTSSSGTLSPLGYQGQYTDSGTGFIYLRARYYDPATAQFLTVDPVVASTNERYGYVAGDPLNSADPSGLCKGFMGCLASHSYSILEGAANGLTGGLVASIDEALSPGSTCTYAHDAFYAGGYAGGFAAGIVLTDGLSTEADVASSPGLLTRLARRLPAAGDDTGSISIGRYNEAQNAVIQRAKQARKVGGLSRDEADQLVQAAVDAGLDARGPETHPGRSGWSSTNLHIHIGPINHIPVI